MQLGNNQALYINIKEEEKVILSVFRKKRCPRQMKHGQISTLAGWIIMRRDNPSIRKEILFDTEN